MSKLIQPVMGRPIREVLNELKRKPIKKGTINEPDRKRFNKERDEINCTISYLLQTVNPGVCVQELQGEFVANEILNNEQGRDMDYDLTVLMNSFSLNCKDCLNGKCRQRDPEQPVPSVKKPGRGRK